MDTQELVQALLQDRMRETARVELEREARALRQETKVAHRERSSSPNGLAAGDSDKEVRLFTGAGHVLAAVLSDPGATIRDLARRCDRTERGVWQVLQELQRAGLLRRQRQGRRNLYEVDVQAIGRQLQAESAPLLELTTG